MHTVHIKLTAVYFAIAFFEIDLAHTHGLYLRSEKLNACLELFFYEELVMCASVLGEKLSFLVFCHW